MPVFSTEDLQFFDDNGYVILRNAVPRENCEAVIDAIWQFLEMNPNDPNDWYRAPHNPGGMVEMYQHQALWNNRQHPRVHEAFSQLLGIEKLWVSEDRCGMKPPSRADKPDWDHKGFIHWDLDVTKPLPQTLRLQGVLVLRDTAENMGGFQCIPGFHKNLAQWLADNPQAVKNRTPDLDALPPGMKVTPILAKQGDLIIWNVLLAHGNGHNTSQEPRFSQYITMHPAGTNEEHRQARIERWRNREAPSREWVKGDERHWEQQNPPAELTPLGRKLLGLDLWD